MQTEYYIWRKTTSKAPVDAPVSQHASILLNMLCMDDVLSVKSVSRFCCCKIDMEL
jgi:hypothetical protein